MARPSLQPGELRSLNFTEYPDNVPTERWRCRGRMRLRDASRQDPLTGAYAPGRRVDVTGFGATPEAAERACRKAAARRVKADALTAVKQQRASRRVHTVQDTAELLLAKADKSGELAASSLASYRTALVHIGVTDLARMDVAAVRPTHVADALALITARSAEHARAARGGTGAAKTARSLLNRVFRHAVRVGWIDASPVRDAGALSTPRRGRSNDGDQKPVGLDHERALTRGERVTLAWAIARSETAKRRDVRDIVLAGMAIGGRIGEVCAIRWCDVTVVRSEAKGLGGLAGSVLLAASVDRIAGKGIVRHQPKTDASIRTVPLPRRVVALLVRRAGSTGIEQMSTDERPVFPNPGRWGLGDGWRDRSNTAAALRTEFDAAGFRWLSYHGLRRAAVTALADHLPIRAVADFAGHKSIRTTLDSYIGRAAVRADVADYL